MADSTEQDSLTAHQHEQPEPVLTLKEKMKQPRFWFIWLVRLLVFSITGSLSVRLTSLFVHKVLGMDGAFKSAPWFPYRIVFIISTLPIYTILIVTIGTLAGQRLYFSRIAQHIWSCCIPGNCFCRRRDDNVEARQPLLEEV